MALKNFYIRIGRSGGSKPITCSITDSFEIQVRVKSMGEPYLAARVLGWKTSQGLRIEVEDDTRDTIYKLDTIP